MRSMLASHVLFLMALTISGMKALKTGLTAGEESTENNYSRLAEGYSRPELAINAPFVVMLATYALYEGYIPICTGSIVHKEYVLTAAHCVDNQARKPLIFAGANNLVEFYHLEDCYGSGDCQRREFKRTHIHPKHYYANSVMSKYDIALIQVNKPFVYNKRIGQVKLWAKKWLIKGEDSSYGYGTYNCTALGWGTLDNKVFSEELRTAPIQARHGRFACPCMKKSNERRLICAGGYGEPGRVCQGDSGGPLICDGLLAGIAKIIYDSRCNILFGQLTCTGPTAVSAWTYVCPLLGYVNAYVPDTPSKPADCKSPRSLDISAGLLVLMIVLSIIDCLPVTRYIE